MISLTSTSVKASTELSSCSLVASSEPCLAPSSIRCCTRASPSAVSAVSAEEKKALRKSPRNRVIHCQVGTKVPGFYPGRLLLPVVADQLGQREEVRDLDARILRRVGSVHAV